MPKRKIIVHVVAVAALFLAGAADCDDPPRSPSDRPPPPRHTQTWRPGQDPARPIARVGDSCTRDNARGRTSDGRTLLCRHGKWTLS